MAARGHYAKGRMKRAEILDTALAVIAEHGYSKATVKELADAVGLSQMGLLHYFGSKDALFAEILRHRDEADASTVDLATHDFAATLVTEILRAVEVETASPGMAQLTMRVVGEATEAGHVAHDFLRDRYTAIRAIVQTAVDRLRDRGEVTDDVDAEAVASLLFAAWDGLRIQHMYDRSIDVRARMTYLVRRLGLPTEEA